MNIEEVWPEWHESELIGEGSFGKVYKATREEFGETFFSAIKVLSVPKSDRDIRQERAQGMSDLEIHAYFQSIVQDLANEIVLMESLKGAANIVSIDDYRIIERTGEIGWDIFIRMELMRPFDEVANSPNFSVTDVLKMGVDICSALVVCEYNKIVHRDIKPDNIFVFCTWRKNLIFIFHLNILIRVAEQVEFCHTGFSVYIGISIPSKVACCIGKNMIGVFIPACICAFCSKFINHLKVFASELTIA